MKGTMLAALLGLAAAMFPTQAQADESVVPLAERLQEVSVTIKTGHGEGSGVVKTRDGVNYVWTAAHMVEGNRRTRSVIDANGSTRTIVEFTDVSIVQSLYEDGRKVGQIEMLAEVIRYSDADYGEDLALLRVRKRNFIGASASFFLDDRIPTVGTKLLHVGSLHGHGGSNSVTDGIISQPGRVLHDGKVYDQTTVTAFPGSSGGGVFFEDTGLYIGMLTRGAGETFNFVVPIRRMRDWAARTGVLFAIDDSVPVPDAEAIAKMPIEDVGRDFKAGRATGANHLPDGPGYPHSKIHTWLYPYDRPDPSKMYGPKVSRDTSN